MANPQREKGHIDIANDIAEALARIRISGEEWQILWVILRKTWGWKVNPQNKQDNTKKKMDAISITQFEKFTKLKRANAHRAIQRLLAKNVIVSEKANSISNNTNSQTISYGIQKNYERWQPLVKKLTVINKANSTVSNKANKGVSEKAKHKRNYTKETTTKEKKGFQPPTYEEVLKYCKERNNDVDPKKFWDFFTASKPKWVDSRGNKVKNWKQKIITWEKRGNKQKTGGIEKWSQKRKSQKS